MDHPEKEIAERIPTRALSHGLRSGPFFHRIFPRTGFASRICVFLLFHGAGTLCRHDPLRVVAILDFVEKRIDVFVKSPTSAFCFISLSLRRTQSTPHDTKFARLEFEAFYKIV